MKDSRSWKRIPSQEAFKFFPAKAFPLTPAIDPFEGHHLRSMMEGLHFSHVAADAKVVVVSPKLGAEHRPPDVQFADVANGFQPQICRYKLGFEFL